MMKGKLGCAAFVLATQIMTAQFATDWNTSGADAQRSGWMRSDAKISAEAMAKPGFELVWKADLDKKAGAPYPTTAPVLLDFYIGYRGFRSLAFIGAQDNRVVTFDSDLGRVEWEKNFDVPVSTRGTAACPGGMTAGVTRGALIGYPPASTPRGFGRGTPARSGVGEPFAGAVTLVRTQPRRPVAAQPAKPVGNRRPLPSISPFAPRVQWLYALAADGKLHSMYVSNGEEPKPPVTFLPAGAHAKGLLIAENFAYAATVNGCGGADNGVWSMEVPSGKVAQWKSGGASPAGAGPSIGPDGTVYAAAGQTLVALHEGSLAQKGMAKIGRDEFTSSPVIFDVSDKDYVAVATKAGRVHLFEAGTLTPLTATTDSHESSVNALSTWQDATATRWLLAPGANGLTAWKVVEQEGKAALQEGWTARQVTGSLAPIIVSDVVFAVSGGASAVLYALDGKTGKELWNSGKTITGPVTTGGLAAGGTRVYVAAQDGTQYVFGYPIEH